MNYNNEKDPEIWKAIFALVFLIVLVFGVLFIANKGQKNNAKIEAIYLNKSQMTVNIGQSEKLVAELSPKNSKYKVEWVSSNPNIAAVSDGEVKGISVGSVIITAKVNNKVRAECVVFVDGLNQGVGPNGDNEAILPEQIILNETKYSLKVDETYNLMASFVPAIVSDDTITWTSSDESVVSVYNGQIRGLKVGSAVITASTINGKTASCEVTVLPVMVESISFNSNNESITVGGTVQLIVNITPINASNKEISWYSSDNNIATVSNGLVTGKKIGKATISATVDGKKANATINVVAKAIPIKSISVTPNNVSTSIDKAISLKATISPSNATNKNIVWTSSNNSIAIVNSNGVVTPKKTGVVTITAKAGGKSATAKVSINSVKVTGVTLDKSTATLSKGDTLLLHATVLPSNAYNKGVTWTSTAPGIASVDQNGKVTAKSDGNADIIVRTNDGGFAKSAAIKVSGVKATGVTILASNTEVNVGSTLTLRASISPAEAANRPVTWTSSDKTVATVSNGTVRGLKAGTVKITAIVDGKSSTISIGVNEIPVTGISITGSKNTFYANYIDINDLKTQLTAVITPSNASNKKVTWTSSNTNAVTVDSNGNIAVNRGTNSVGPVTITARTSNGKTATYSVVVKKKVLAVITASQGNRMNNVVNYYQNIPQKMEFSKSQKSLYFIARSGSGVCFQAGIKALGSYDKLGGFQCKDSDQTGSNTRSDMAQTQTGNMYMIQELNNTYGAKREYVEPIIIYTMPGNSIKGLSCDGITSAKYQTLAKAYVNAYKYYRDANGYNLTKVYMVSHFPVHSTMAKNYYEANNIASSSRKVVSSGNSNKCNASYISAWKYYTSGKVFKSALSSVGSNITYVNVFSKFMQVKDSGAGTMQWNPDRPFSFKIEDSLHMDPATAEQYAYYMFDRVLAA